MLNKNFVSEVELTYKAKIKASLRPSINNSEDTYKILLNIWDMAKIELLEQFYVLYLNADHKVLAASLISTGGISACIADPRVILVIGLKLSATHIVLAHSHPSGSLTPSASDILLTGKIKDAAKLLDIKVLDHLIVTSESYCSFADEELI